MMNPQQFQQRIEQARRVALLSTEEGSLWKALLRTCQLSEEDLIERLQKTQGVVVLSTQEVTSSDNTNLAVAEGIKLVRSSVGKTYVLCVDPWDDSTISWFSRHNDGNFFLAIMRPGTSVNRTEVAFQSKAHSSEVIQQGGPVDFVNRAIKQASLDGASDIHFETNRGGIGVKYRLDGVMVAGEQLATASLAEQVISRIKVLADLDITERRKPQDGRIRWTGQEQHAIDLRVSIMPSVFGEDAVLRLLDKAQLRSTPDQITLEALGFDSVLSGAIRELAARPHGMLLVTGPTGSGKTTTLYATLSEINTGIEKIITIEDPVEYELAGVLQIPVNERKGLTFATGLRSILRHDPDRILVGEIRDAETAEISVQAALTGHVVFTTVHANSLFDVLGRFQHFNIDPFAFASSLNGIVVQRLLRKLCEHCIEWRELGETERDRLILLGVSPPHRVAVARGCTQCRQTGYKGRFVVSQVHQVDDGLRDLVLRKSSISEIKAHMLGQAGESLLAQAVLCAARGLTSLEEVKRVIGWS